MTPAESAKETTMDADLIAALEWAVKWLSTGATDTAQHPEFRARCLQDAALIRAHIETLRNGGERAQIVAALRWPSEATLRAFWDSLPSPIEIDLKDDEAGVATLRAVADAAIIRAEIDRLRNGGERAQIVALEAERDKLAGIVRGWHWLAVGPDEMGDYLHQRELIKASEPYASPALKALAKP